MSKKYSKNVLVNHLTDNAVINFRLIDSMISLRDGKMENLKKKKHYGIQMTFELYELSTVTGLSNTFILCQPSVNALHARMLDGI